jgi:hypothetical protein
MLVWLSFITPWKKLAQCSHNSLKLIYSSMKDLCLYHHIWFSFISLFCDKASLPFVRKNHCHCLHGVQTLLQACSLLFPVDSGEGSILGMLIRQGCHCIVTSNTTNYVAAVDCFINGGKCVHHTIDCFLWEIVAGIVYCCLYHFILSVTYRIF